MTLYHFIALLAAPVAGYFYASWRWPRPVLGETASVLIVTAASALDPRGPSFFLILFAGALCLSLVGFWLNGRRFTISRLTIPH